MGPAKTPEQRMFGIDPWDKQTPLEDDEVEVPYLKDIEFACGDGSALNDDYNGKKLRFSKATLRKVGANSDGDGVLCFAAHGNSMEPVIADGSTVAINCHDKRIVDGKIYGINQGGWKRLKILYRSGPDKVTIRSYNSDEYPDEEVDMDSLEVLGSIDPWDKQTPLEDDEVEVPYLKDIEFACGDGSALNDDYNGKKL
ncbi:S24 family peptidase, partial [Enterobacter hormaechei]|uniref:S24 family peptidase n=1 Tax=Enterobacter hormaechei TaxID=158836 RepID=UPI003D9CB01A